LARGRILASSRDGTEKRRVEMVKSGRDDGELIRAANKGDAGAFEEIYYRYRDWVTGLAFRFNGNEQDALDILQETFIYLLRKFPGFRPSASMTTVLYPVVRNLSIAARRRRLRYLSLSNANGAVAPRRKGMR